jgi:TetR/AcrR family transcriptional regulator
MWSDIADAGAELTRTQQARRDDIIAAAIAVIDRDGYAAASIDKIAKEAKTSKSTVLYHFKTKQAINNAVVSALFEHGAAYMTRQINEADSRRDKLHAYLTSNFRFIAEHAAHVRAVHRIQENASIQIDGDDAVAPLRQLLAAGQDAGEFGAFDPEVMALAIRAIVDAASFHFTAHPDIDVEHYIDQAVQLFDKATKP